MFTYVFPGFYKRCFNCKLWKLDSEYSGKNQHHCRDRKQSYCRVCANETRKKYYRDHLQRSRFLSKLRTIKYLAHRNPEVAERTRKNSNEFRVLQRLVQRKARGKLVISLVCQVWEVEPEMLQGRITQHTPENIRVARAVVTTLFRRLTHFHPDAIADRFDIATHDIARHGMIFREYTNYLYGDITILEKINKVRRLYKEQKDRINKEAKLPFRLLPRFDAYSQAELQDWKAPVVDPVEYPKGISVESLFDAVCWFTGSSDVTRCQQITQYILWKYHGWSYNEIAEKFQKHHSTCRSNIRVGARIADMKPLVYELNRVWTAEQRLVVLLCWIRLVQRRSLSHNDTHSSGTTLLQPALSLVQ